LTPVDVETAFPESPMSPKFRRRLAILVGLTAVLIPVLSWVEAENDRQEEQAFVRGSRGALDIFVRIAASQPRTQFQGDALREALAVGAEGVSRAANATDLGISFDYALALSKAARRAEKRIAKAGEQMGEAPTEEDGVDADTVDAVNSAAAEFTDLSVSAELGEVAAAQESAIDEAGKYGTRQERGLYALGLAAIAASLLGLAGLMGESRAGRTSLVSAAIALVVALGVGASGYVF
jgi:hypothetical protein